MQKIIVFKSFDHSSQRVKIFYEGAHLFICLDILYAFSIKIHMITIFIIN